MDFAVRLNRLLLPLLLGAFFCALLPAQSRSGTHLTVDVRLLPHAHGDLAYLVFNAPSGFPGKRDKSIRHGFLPIPAGAREIRFETDLPPGTYAVSVYEDLNGNHQLDHNFLGIPKEPVGASNNPHPHFGPPGFDECSFRVGLTPLTISISIVSGL